MFSKKWLTAPILLCAALVALSWLDLFDLAVSDHLETVMGEVVIAFGTSKVIMSAVSILQGVEVNLGIGVAATVQPFAFLAPLAGVANDFGELMRIAIVSIITQVFLLKIVSSIYFKILLTAAGAFYLFSSLFCKTKPNIAQLAFKLFVFSIFLRFAVVISIGLSIAINNMILQKPVNEHMKNVSAFSEQIDIESNTSGLTEEERSALGMAITGRLAQLEALTKQAQITERALQVESSLLEKLQAEVKEQKDSLGYINSLISSDEKLSDLSQRLALQEATVKHLESTLDDLKGKQADLVKDNLKEENRLNGKDIGLWKSISNSAKKITNNIMGLKSKIQDIYNNFGTLAIDMMYVMAAFLLRTLIMPLLFLYALLKAFRLIWEKDLRTALLEAKQDIEKELKG